MMKNYFLEELNGFVSWLVLLGTFIVIFIYSQLAANDNLVLGAHDGAMSHSVG